MAALLKGNWPSQRASRAAPLDGQPGTVGEQPAGQDVRVVSIKIRRRRKSSQAQSCEQQQIPYRALPPLRRAFWKTHLLLVSPQGMESAASETGHDMHAGVEAFVHLHCLKAWKYFIDEERK